jgi:hypothetical protein
MVVCVGLAAGLPCQCSALHRSAAAHGAETTARASAAQSPPVTVPRNPRPLTASPVLHTMMRRALRASSCWMTDSILRCMASWVAIWESRAGGGEFGGRVFGVAFQPMARRASHKASAGNKVQRPVRAAIPEVDHL